MQPYVTTKPYTIKLECEALTQIFYLRAPDEATYLAWHQALWARLGPPVLQQLMKTFRG